jgi:hypothetical protein
MTVDQRNLYFKAGIFLSLFCLAVLVFLAGKLLPFYPELCGQALHRPEGFLQNPFFSNSFSQNQFSQNSFSQNLADRIFSTTPPSVYGSLIASAVYTLCASILLFIFFEKTPSPEILFIGLFALSFVFETLRIMVPLQKVYAFPSALLAAGTRLLFLGRFSGIFSLFISSLYAAGINTQKQGRMVLAMLIAILLVVLRIPVSGQSWDTGLVMLSGFSSMLRLTEAVLIVITIVSFLVASYAKDTKEYLFVALGVFLAFLGRGLLTGTDTWAALALGVLMLAGGTWLIMLWLHRVYLWL